MTAAVMAVRPVAMREGMRVILVRDVRTVIRGEDGKLWNAQEVTLDNGVKDTLSVVPAGTRGTLYRFRIRKGLPTFGMPHPEMWGVAYDGIPLPLCGHFGQAEATFLGSHLREDGEQDAATALLREEWLAALARRREVEDRIAAVRARLPAGTHNIGRPDLWEALAAAEAEAEARRRAYDQAAGLPSRQV